MDFVAILCILLFLLLFGSVFIVRQQSCAVIERLGKFNRIAHPGLHWKIPIIDDVVSTLSLRINQLGVSVETKTLDNVFVNVVVAVQYRVLPEKVFEACYALQNPEYQIKAFVFDLVRAQVPKLSLDDVFSKKNDIADAMKMNYQNLCQSLGTVLLRPLLQILTLIKMLRQP